MDFSLAILTGGKSLRFGTDKCTYRLYGKSMTQWLIESIGCMFKEILFIGQDPGLKIGSVFPDVHPNKGPVGGVESALLNSKSDHIFLVACDMPFVIPEVVKRVLNNTEKHSIVCPVVNGKCQTTHAVYSKFILELVQTELKREKSTLTHIVLNSPNVLLMNESRFKDIKRYKESFKNFNLLEELNSHLLFHKCIKM